MYIVLQSDAIDVGRGIYATYISGNVYIMCLVWVIADVIPVARGSEYCDGLITLTSNGETFRDHYGAGDYRRYNKWNLSFKY